MLKLCGIGVAMGNAIQEVKEADKKLYSVQIGYNGQLELPKK